MFSLNEVILIVLVVSVIVGYIAYQFAEFSLITRMLSTLSDEELDRLERLKKQIEDAVTDEEADAIVERFAKENDGKSKTLTQEVISGQTFLYDENDNFVAQGSSAAEAAEIFFNSRHSAEVAVVKCNEGNSYRIVNGKIES
jgi:hypothetical protein